MATTAKTVAAAKTDFVGKVLTALKGGDEVVAGNIQATIVKEWENEIKTAKKLKAKLAEDMKDVSEKSSEDLKEAQEKLEETFLNLDLSCKSRDSREAFVKGAYISKIKKAQYEVDSIKVSIAKSKEEAKVENERLDGIIALYTGYLDFVQ